MDEAAGPHTKGLPPPHPELIKPFQEMVGAVMYLCNSTRPDLAYPVHQLCRAMSRPTPELLTELEFVFYYLSKNPDIGLTFEKGDCFPLEGRADASWETYRSTSGGASSGKMPPSRGDRVCKTAPLSRRARRRS